MRSWPRRRIFWIGKVKADTPFFVWFNASHMHFRTHVKPEIRGQAGRWQSEYHDVMIEHDQIVGKLLKKLDDLGVADDTDRHVQHRQRTAYELMARRRYDAVSQREGFQLGRRFPRAMHGPLAGRDQTRHRVQ